MPRRRITVKREVLPDSRYNSRLVTKFINCFLYDGKRSTAERHFYKALEVVEERVGQNGLKVFSKAVDNVKPFLEVRSRRVGGSTYQVPVDVRPSRRQALAIRWIINFTRKRGEKSVAMRLANEIIDAYNGRGSSVKKRDDTHKMAEANKAFAHYRW
jgi:small subunit ribosomal protein S7